MSPSMSGYRNPVIPGFFPDPSVCRVGDEYFLAASTFTYFPGVPILRSRNLVDWEHVGNALDRPSQLDLATTSQWTSGGIFAPTLRHHDGRFWMITTVASGAVGLQNFFVTADDAAGPWSEPVVIPGLGIDPDLAWDDDGNCWVHYCSVGAISRVRIDPTNGQVLDGPHRTWSGTGLQYPEAPHLFRRGAHWYLLIAEGGTERGHAISIARGPSPEGPWTSCPRNPILSHRSTDHPVQNAGHGDLVEAGDGSWWMVLLGARPRGTTPHFHVLGRETFLAPVEWVDDWPSVGPVELEMPVAPPGPPTPVPSFGRDDFDTSALHPRWLSIRVPPATHASTTERAGHLLLHGAAALEDDAPAFVGCRQRDQVCRAEARLDPMTVGEAGLTLWMDHTAHYDVYVAGDRVVARARVGPLVQEVGEAPVAPGGAITLWLACDTVDAGNEPDVVTLGYVHDDGAAVPLASLPGRYLSTEVATGFTGRVIGMFAVAGDAAFDWFEYSSD